MKLEQINSAINCESVFFFNSPFEIDQAALNSRGPETLSSKIKAIGGKTKAGTVSDALVAEVIFLAVPWKNLIDVVKSLPSLKGKIVIDATNPIITPGFHIADLGGITSSEVVGNMIPGAYIIKALNTLTPTILSSALQQGGGDVSFFIREMT
ncbi:MAG: hypothetical protein C0490_15640 [Marivirga sp.]|nr:hypothetical protein [Marivirga sp.]